MATQKQKQKGGQQNKSSPPKVSNVKSKSKRQSLTKERLDRTAREQAIAQKEREDYRHSGIPIGSDPRE